MWPGLASRILVTGRTVSLDIALISQLSGTQCVATSLTGLRASFEVIQASCWQTEAQDEFRPDTSFPVPSASQHESCSCFTTCGRLTNGITQSIRKASARLVVLTQSLSSLPMTWSIKG